MVHSVGFQAFGTSHGPEVEMKELEEVEWPDEEVHNGVHSVVIHAYGDWPKDAFIVANAASEELARAACKRIHECWTKMRGDIWQTATPS